MTSKKTPSRFKEWLPPLIFGGFFIGLIAIPQLRDKFFPAVTTHIVEWKDKIVQVEKEKVVHERPTVSVNTVKVTVTQVTDGDTIHAEIELPLGVKLINQRIRCLGYDAYELSELKGPLDYDAWERALTCVPCAPILKTYTKKREFLFAASQESYAVTTRFCGMAHEDVFNMQTGSSLEIQKFFTELNTLLHRQRMVIIAELLKHGIVHTHPHTHNFTVEFVRKDALESHAAQLQEPLYKKSILNPTVINSMPYKKEHIAFLPSEYVGNPNLYVPVSRIIDFDGSLINESFVQLTSDQKMDWYQKVILLQYGPLLDVHDRKELTTLLRGEDPWQNT
jgi:hypothetical protein